MPEPSKAPTHLNQQRMFSHEARSSTGDFAAFLEACGATAQQDAATTRATMTFRYDLDFSQIKRNGWCGWTSA